MAGPRRSPVLPAKRPRAKAAKPVTTTNPPLSSEFVVDSDDSGIANTAGVKKSASGTAKPISLSTKPAAAPRPSTSQAKASKKRKSPSASPADDASSGSGSGNDSNSQDEKRPPKKSISAVNDGSPTPKPKPATARPVLAKPSIKPSTNVKPLNRKKVPRLGASKSLSSSEAGESSENSSTGSESGSESEPESGSSGRTSTQNPRKEGPVSSSLPQRSIPTFEPPAGFKSSSVSLHPASKVSELLAPSNLQGKQVWHVTAPESVPLSLVKEVSTQSLGSGASILEYQGAKYGLVPGLGVEQASSQALLFPSVQTNDYRPLQTPIIKTLHLQQLVSLPGHALEPAVHPNPSIPVSESYKRTPRQQPEGLRMRYRPFGASDDSDSESIPEPMPKVPEFRLPAPAKESSPGRKRKRPESNDHNSNTHSAVETKKRRKTFAVTVDDPMDVDATSDQSLDRAESPIKRPHSMINSVKSNGNPPNGNETTENRKKRRKKQKPEQQEPPPKPATALPLDLKQTAETIEPGEVIESAPAAIANATEGTATINATSPQTPSKDTKAARKEERRKRREMKANRDASSLPAGISPTSPHQVLQEIENAQRPGDDSPEHGAKATHGQESGLDRRRNETKEERAKRKKERRRRRMRSGSA